MSREDLIGRFRRDRWLAHKLLFAHRHRQAPALFHRELVEDYWSADAEMVILGFRGGAKSTFAEEDIILDAVEGNFHVCLIIGANEARAGDRLAAIKRELDMNEALIELYGPQHGAEWRQEKILTAGGVAIKAMGRDQDIRGLKEFDWRPDRIIVDDFESRENVQTPEARKKTLDWFTGDLLPACDPEARVRVYGTPMDADSVPMELIKHGWASKVYPIVRRHPESGEEEPTWPDRFPMKWIDRTRDRYRRQGQISIWEREYMCRAVSDEDRVFRPEDIRVDPTVRRTWHAVWAMVDPARTVRRETSAMTGIVVWSWIANRLVVWEDLTGFWKPDEIIARIFEVNQRYSPVEIGVEEDGLHEFIHQPLRAEQLRRGCFVPLRPLRAPRGKLDFIRGLQPFFRAGEVSFASEMPELRGQLLGFPSGRIDAPNALAYALLMRPGVPVYDCLQPTEHIAERIYADDPRRPLWLACNSTGAYTTAVLVLAGDGRLAILADWVREGDPGSVAADIVREASLESHVWLRTTAPPPHFNEWNNVGLAQALRAVPAEVTKGGPPERGRAFLRREMQRMVRGAPPFQVSERARWTLNAFAGGYARKVGAPEPEPSVYRTLMEGLESFAALLAIGVVAEEDDDAEAGVMIDRWGRRYKTAMPDRHRELRRH